MVEPHLSLISISALVVDPSGDDRAQFASALTWVGFNVLATDNFRDAKVYLKTKYPLVLVTEIRLRDFNGLQLALHAASLRHVVATVVTTDVLDSVLKHEAERIGSTFALKPLTRPDLLAAIFRTALRRRSPGGRVESIEPPFERRRGERRRNGPPRTGIERRVADRRRDIGDLLRRAASYA